MIWLVDPVASILKAGKDTKKDEKTQGSHVTCHWIHCSGYCAPVSPKPHASKAGSKGKAGSAGKH
jgi:hypothetical protein